MQQKAITQRSFWPGITMRILISLTVLLSSFSLTGGQFIPDIPKGATSVDNVNVTITFDCGCDVPVPSVGNRSYADVVRGGAHGPIPNPCVSAAIPVTNYTKAAGTIQATVA
jgi:hypothetical protein